MKIYSNCKLVKGYKRSLICDLQKSASYVITNRLYNYLIGNIKDTTLQEALDHPDFRKYWNITKDQIAVCKDCEFRYICTDCRAYIENPEDIYSKPLKCGYNPYTSEWEEWSTNPLKQTAIDFYAMREVLPEFKMKPDYVPPTNTSTFRSNPNS